MAGSQSEALVVALM